MGGPRREGPTIPVLAMRLTEHCDTYDSFLDTTYGVFAEWIIPEDALRPEHRAQSTEAEKRGFSPFLGGRKTERKRKKNSGTVPG